MVLDGFLAWAQTATADQRAEGASALARAFLYSDLDDEQHRIAELTLTALLDDPAVVVRRAIAEAVASSAEAPRHLVTALANDHSSVAAPVLKRSPQLCDSDLVDCVAMGDSHAQSAIATRPELSAAVAAALAEVGGREPVIVLCVNDGADLPEFSMHRILERFGADGEVREALLQRGDLPASVRIDLVSATAGALSAFVNRCGWLPEERAERVTREARERATIALSASACRQRRAGADFVRHLRACGQLTAGLVLRALLSGHRGLFDAALAELSGQSPERVAGLVERWSGSGFEALYRRAGLPETLLPAFRAALAGQEEYGFGQDEVDDLRLQRVLVERVLTACDHMPAAEVGKLMSLLRRYEAEAAREEAREHALVAMAAGPEPALPAAQIEAEPAIAITVAQEESVEAPEILLADPAPEDLPDEDWWSEPVVFPETPVLAADERPMRAADASKGTFARALRMAFRRAA